MGNTGFISSIVGVGFGESYAIDMAGALRDSLGSHSSFDTLGLGLRISAFRNSDGMLTHLARERVRDLEI